MEQKVTKVEIDRPIHTGIEMGMGLLVVYLAWKIVVFALQVVYIAFTLA